MSKDILQILQDKPQDVFKLFTTGSDNHVGYFNNLAKSLIDPISKEFSVLDEIYVDGLDSSQVFGQTKMVLDGVGEKLMGGEISELRDVYGEIGDEDASEEEDVEGDSEDGDESDEEVYSERFEEEEGEEDLATLKESDQEDLEDEVDAQEDLEDEVDSQVESTDELKDDEPLSDTETNVSEEHVKDVHGLNDGFFDIDTYNKNVLALEENDGAQSDDEEIDYFGDLGEDDDEEEMAYYDDIFDKPGSVKAPNSKPEVENDDDDDEEEEADLNEEEYDNAVGSAMTDFFEGADEPEPESEEETEKPLSSFEKQQQEIQAEIAKLEAELVADKKWTMKGEVGAKDRPRDSLLDDPETATLDFDRTAKPVPIITQEVTELLEELIRRRIKIDEFEDLPKRLISDVSRFHNKKKLELSEQKSSKSLAEEYEDDYNKVDQNEEINAEVQTQHDEIAELFQKVNHKLDALCSAHYIPKPHQYKTIDIKVSDNAAALITMEDAQPLHVDSASTLAPQEVYKIGDDRVVADGVHGRSQVQLKSGLSYSKDELSTEDKQRLRRANKRKKTKAYNEKAELKEQREKQEGANTNKRQKIGEVVDTLSKAKNVTVIGKKGELTDVKGNVKKTTGIQSSNNFKL